MGYKAIVNNVVNIVFMDALTNDQIKNRNPADYIADFQSKNPHLPAILNSHYIKLDGYGIESNDFYAFINARSKVLYEKLLTFIEPSKHDSLSDTDAIS